MITAFLILFPLLTGLLVCLIKDQKAKQIALGISVIEFIASIVAFYSFHTSGQDSALLSVNAPWIERLGISFYLGLDGIGLLLVMLTTFLVPLIILAAFGREYKNPGLFYGLILVMQSALVGVFAAKDAFLFYVFWELALIPIYFISLLWGGADRLKVTFKFFIYTLSGSLFMLVALIYLYTLTPSIHTFSIDAFYNLQLSPVQQMWVFWALFLAFAIKMPIFPFHTWQPDTYSTSPAPGTMLLSGIMLKMGIFGVIRWMLPIVPLAMKAQWGGQLAIALSVIGIIYASVIALLQKDFKRLIAYVSIAHVGLIAAGVFTMTFEGVQGAVIQMVSHGINVVGLFFAIEIISNRTDSRELTELGGIRSVAPQFTTLFLIIVFSSIALPFTSGFIGEFLLFVSISDYNIVLAAIAGISIILGALYMLQSFQKAMLGETSAKTAGFADLKLNEKLVLIPLVVLIFWIGLYPKLFLDTAEPSVLNIIQKINNTYTLK
jgi:NADH-quinone oxidoreductase subunit M